MDSDLITGINMMLEGELGETFVYDLSLAKTEGKILLCYKETNSPIPLEIPLTEAAMKTDLLNWREVHRSVKDCLPQNILRQCVSEAKTLTRGMSRRNLRDVEKDLKAWRLKTEKNLRRMFSREKVEGFLASTPLPPNIRPGTLQALHFAFEASIDRLNNF